MKLQQPNYDGYLYVDYYTVNGAVAHIYPNAGEPNSGRLLKALEQFEVGATANKMWTVCAPFGQELITVISSPKPLFQETFPEVQMDAKDYLPKLRQMLDANRGNAQLLAAHLFMQTEPENDPSKKQAALTACSAPEAAAPQPEAAQ